MGSRGARRARSVGGQVENVRARDNASVSLRRMRRRRHPVALPRGITRGRGRSYRPDNRGNVCESSGRQGCAGARAPRVRGSANATRVTPVRRSPRQTLYCARCWSTIRTSGLILASLCPELQQNEINDSGLSPGYRALLWTRKQPGKTGRERKFVGTRCNRTSAIRKKHVINMYDKRSMRNANISGRFLFGNEILDRELTTLSASVGY